MQICRLVKKVTHSPHFVLAISFLLLGTIIFPAKSFPVYAGDRPDPNWDRSSFVAVDEGGNCLPPNSTAEVWAEIKNVGEDMDGSVNWELYYANSGNPKNGSVIDNETLGPLAENESTTISSQVNAVGNYMFRVEQRPGHPGQGELWSDTIAVDYCSEPEPCCGDGEINGEEACDGDEPQACVTGEGYAGTQACVDCQWGSCEPIEFCGDGEINGSEGCDDGALNGRMCTPNYGESCQYCSNTCTPETVVGPCCGDGEINGSEECDDENNENGDGCSAECTIETPECVEGPTWASGIVDYKQGTLKNGNPITDPIRTDPSKTLGANDNQFYSLGKSGWIVLNFIPFVVDVDGPDLSFHETTWGSRASYPEEKIGVEVSQDGNIWYFIGEASSRSGGNGVAYLDFSPTGLLWIQYVRLTDATNFGPHGSTADGYDLDAVDATYGVCEEPLPICGNGKMEGDEVCDGEDGVPVGFSCTESCTLNPTGAIYGCKFHDLNQDGRWDQETEPTLPGWTINLNGGDQTVPTTTGDDGCYEFAELPDGEYVVSEVLQTGWEQTYPAEDGTHTITIVEGESHEAVDFGNYLLPPTPSREPDLEVEKEVSTDTTEVNTIVTYTIIVSNTGETVLDITVTDVPPAGFTYVTGSALVGGVPSEPTLSGGSLIWELKDVDPGTDVTITYQMNVGSTASEDALENTVFAASGEIKKWDPAEVLVTEEEEEGEVLGVRSEPEVLAETGAAPVRLLIIWAIASAMLGLGLILRTYAQTLAKKNAS